MYKYASRVPAWRQVFGPREAVLSLRSLEEGIHGGIKAREINEESVILGMVS
jgi:hypothetical protein